MNNDAIHPIGTGDSNASTEKVSRITVTASPLPRHMRTV